MDPVTTRPAPCAGLRIGDIAPDFLARSTIGEVRLSDFRGRWLILFSHPADFTPVCTTEFVAMAKASADFAQRDCALMALSVDSLFSHFAWLRLMQCAAALKPAAKPCRLPAPLNVSIPIPLSMTICRPWMTMHSAAASRPTIRCMARRQPFSLVMVS